MIERALLDQLSPEERERILIGAQRHAETIDRALDERRWVDVLHLQDRNDGPRLVWEWWEGDLLTVDDLRDLIPEAWVGAEFPLGHLGERKWLRLFRVAGYVYRWTNDARVQGDISAPPTSERTLYRGAPLWTRGRGMSWSMELASAEWFAERWASLWGASAAVYTATVPAKAILAMFNDRAEQEVVVNPNMLRSRIRTVRTIEAVQTVEHAVFGTVHLSGTGEDHGHGG